MRSGQVLNEDLRRQLFFGLGLGTIPAFVAILTVLRVWIGVIRLVAFVTAGRGAGLGSIYLPEGMPPHHHLLIDPFQQFAPRRTNARIHSAGIDERPTIM